MDSLAGSVVTGQGEVVPNQHGRLRLDIRKKFFYAKAGETLEQVAREVADAPSQETFKVRLDGTLSSVI